MGPESNKEAVARKRQQQSIYARQRVVISGVTPEIADGRYPIKRAREERVRVEADIFADSHDALSAVLLVRRQKGDRWNVLSMRPLVNDRWYGSFLVDELGRYAYTLQAWVDRFKTWRRDLQKKVADGQDVAVDLLAGAGLLENAASRAKEEDADRLRRYGDILRGDRVTEVKIRMAFSRDLLRLMTMNPDRRFATTYHKQLIVVVEPRLGRYSSWYEMFPRSAAAEPERHATFKDCENRLPTIAAMGFDVLYLPPIHPIGHTNRKGRNNSTVAEPDDVGSPWAIGSQEGGHKAVHPLLGTLDDFRRLVQKAAESGIDIALDLAFQCSPDHPYVREHPEWFRQRPDGTVQYAENPPKKYEDIIPFDFECDAWQSLFDELLSVVQYWIEQGVRIFRVDNPHTKSFSFWEWLIHTIKVDSPEVIFLAEAFTRPKIMYRLAQLGFTQSYTYFAWRNTKWELEAYFEELTTSPVAEFFWPNLWPNTPDILTEYLQTGGRPAFIVRLILAATLGANFGIYGPAFEQMVDTPIRFGTEEYSDSEKYQIRFWDTNRPDSLKDLITRVNRIRRENPALQQDRNLFFIPVDNEQLVSFGKYTEDRSNIVIVVANLDPHHTHSGWVDIALEDLQLEPQQPYQVHDLLSDARYLWHGGRNYIELNPQVMPAHIFRIRKKVRTERDFDYFT
ncbi:MAG: alpha-1,4-glucan--maltose-1-phosphate maltosyltransferase [Desulfobacterales bacterium]